MSRHIKSSAINVLTAFLLLFSLASCKPKGAEVKDAKKENKASTSEVKLTADQIKAISLKTDTVSFRNLKSSLKVNGKLMLPPQNQAQVSVLIGGIVKDIPVTEGVFVNKGDVLAILENTEFLQVQQEFLENKSSLKYLEAEYNRQKELQKENINSTKTFQQVEADYTNSVTKSRVLSAKLKLFGVNPETLTSDKVKSTFAITAPISGSIKHIDVFIGKYAEPNKQIFEIVDNRFLHIDLTVYEQDVAKIKTGQQVMFTIINDSHHPHTANIFSVNKAFEDNQQAVIAHAKINAIDDNLLPGMFIEARVQIDSYEAMSLPNEAIVSNGSDHYIFIDKGDGKYQEVQITVGTTDMNFTEITPLQNLSSGSRIVTTGAYYLLSQLTKGEGEDHE